MAKTASTHGRTQNLLMFSKVIDCRDNASPLTLALDSLEQTARPLITAYLQRASVTRTSVIFVSFETLKPPSGVDRFIRAHDQTPSRLETEIRSAISANSQGKRHLIIFDSLHPLIAAEDVNVATFLSGLITLSVSLLCIYHTDQPLPADTISNTSYNPDALTLLRFLATTLLTMQSFAHLVDTKAARERSVAEPVFGLQEDAEGVLQGLGSQDLRGAVIGMEHRRRSGRSIHATFFLGRKDGITQPVVLPLDEHPLYQTESGDAPGDSDVVGEVTFNLGLTDKQRRDRKSVILPYFDAQNDAAAPGEGGRILYNMGAEDDFDEEEDEI